MKNADELSLCSDNLLKNPDKIGDWLQIADKHMQNYADNADMLALPTEHKFLKPLVRTFARDIEGFVSYIVYLRDTYGSKELAYKNIQTVYRKVNGRYIQQQRRARMDRAINKATELFGHIPYVYRMAWMADLEHRWAQRRLDFLEGHRAAYKSDRLPSEDRVELLIEFWNEIDTEINEGNLPSWNSPSLGPTPH
jgi:hypothetical protein